MKVILDQKHFPLLNYFIVRNNPQTAVKKRIAEKNSTFNSTFLTLPLHKSSEVTVDWSNNKIQTQRISDSLTGK